DGVDLLTNLIKYVGNPPIPWGDIPWLSETPTDGVVTPTTAFTDSLTFNSNGLAVGDYTGYLFGLTNDPNAVRQQIQVNLHVCSTGCPPPGPNLVVDQVALHCPTPNCGRPVPGYNNLVATVRNNGTEAVTWLSGYLYVDYYMQDTPPNSGST